MITAARVRAVVVAVMIATTLTVSGATVGSATPSSSSGSWPFANGNLANTRVAVGSTISIANVKSLKEVWSFKLRGKAAKSLTHYGSLAETPIVVNSVVYIQDLYSNVYALSLVSGKLLWEYKVNEAEKSGPGPNGVAVANGAVYGLTPTTAFALNAASGDVLWINKKLLKKGQGTFGIQPQVTGGRMYFASQYGSGPGGGVLFALKSSNGAVLWRFNTLKHPDVGVTSLGLGAGGAWETPLVGNDGSVTFGIGNPYQTLESATTTPSKILYTNSEVNLNAATGKLRWYYQAVPNDFKDFDLQASPIETTINGHATIVGGGKMGIVYAMNAVNGKLVWKTAVGKHNGHDNDSLNLLKHKGALKLPFLYEPGSFGGILTNMAVADNTVYVATIDLALQYTSDSQVVGSAPKKVTAGGEIEALNLTTGKVEWDTKVSQLPLGAATVVNNLVLTTLYDGQLIALNRTTGAVIDRVVLPASTNSGIAVAGDTVVIPAGAPETGTKTTQVPQVVAYRLG